MDDIKVGDTPAFPVTLHNRTQKDVAAWEGLTIAAGASVTYGGLSVRAYAAIALRVPDSGTEWLDEMIRTAQRDELAAKALAGMMASRDPRSPKFDPKDDADYVYAVADAMLAAREAQS